MALRYVVFPWLLCWTSTLTMIYRKAPGQSCSVQRTLNWSSALEGLPRGTQPWRHPLTFSHLPGVISQKWAITDNTTYTIREPGLVNRNKSWIWHPRFGLHPCATSLLQLPLTAAGRREAIDWERFAISAISYKWGFHFITGEHYLSSNNPGKATLNLGFRHGMGVLLPRGRQGNAIKCF